MKIKNVLQKVSLIMVFICIPHIFAIETATETVKVGFVEGYGSITSNQFGNYNVNSGYMYDLLQRLEHYSPFYFEFVEFPEIKIAYDALDNGEIDCFIPAMHTPEREKKYVYTNITTGLHTISLAVKYEENGKYTYGDIDSINGKTVATYYNSPLTVKLDDFCKNNNISINYVTGNINNYHELEADFYLVPSIMDEFFDYINVLTLDIYEGFLICSKNNERLASNLTKVFNETISSDSGLLTRLHSKYYSQNTITRRTLRLDEIQTTKNTEFIVAYNQATPPFCYKDLNGNPAGIDIEVLRRIFQDRLGIENITYVPYKIENNELKGDMELIKKSNILLGSHSPIPFVMDNFNNISDYYSTDAVFISSETFNVNDLSTISNVATINFIKLNKDIRDTSYPNIKLHYRDSTKDLIEGFNNGSYDALIINDTEYAYFSKHLKREFLTTSTNLNISHSFHVRNDMSDKIEAVLNIIANHKLIDGTINRIIEEEQSKLINFETWFETAIRYWYVFVIVITAFIIFLVLRRSINTRNELEKINAVYQKDPLTGLLTFTYGTTVVRAMYENAKNNEYFVVSFDINMFRAINANYGRKKGDEVLIEIANSLKNIFKDTISVFARRRDDIFHIYMSSNFNIKDIYERNLVPVIKQVLKNDDINLSFGIVLVDDVTIDLEEYLIYAENARLQAKKGHSTNFVYVDDTMKKKYTLNLLINQKMKPALENNDFNIVLQPKIDFKTLKVCGAEALVRWMSGDTIIHYPDEFIPIFEENGFIAQLDLYVLGCVCKLIQENRGSINYPVISVNLSAKTLMLPNILNDIMNILLQHNVETYEIELEVTESAMEYNEGAFLKITKMFKMAGFSVSIDDFGAGVSSLKRIADIGADVLKIDKAFLDRNGIKESNKKVIKNIILMAKDLQMKVVMEGVEIPDQAQWLQDIGCDIAQGYYFSRPIKKEEFTNLVLENKAFSIE